MSKLKLDHWASIAEIASGVAVIVSLIYVGIQVNDNAGAVRSASANDANVALQAWYLQMGADQETSELVYRGLTSEEALPAAEEYQFLMMVHAYFLGIQNSYLLAEEGTIDEELRTALTTSTVGLTRLPGMRRYWRQRKRYLHAGFVDWVEQLDPNSVEITMDLYKKSAGESEEH